MIGIRKVVIGSMVTAIFVATFAPLNSAQALMAWVLNEDGVTLNITGVSPHVERTASADRIWYPTLAGTIVADCTDAGACSTVPGTGRSGADFTAVTLPNGTRRAYFVNPNQGTSTKSVFSAECATSECLSVETSILTTSALTVPSSGTAWGVPDAVITPDGRVRLYVVESLEAGNCKEKVASYISSDGISFTKEPGWRFEDGFSTDPEILRARNGDWIMIMAANCRDSERVSKLYLATSSDGLTWSTPQKLTGSDISRIDPTGYEVSSDVFRIYYTTLSSLDPGDKTITIRRATLKFQSTTSESSNISGSKSKTSITCVKGKITKKVSAISPKCPKGYRKK